MPTDKKLKSLVLNVMTEEQYNSTTKNEDELYLTPDEGGGGNYSINVESIKGAISGSGSPGSAYWEDNNSDRIIRPNTHYDVGFSTGICYKYNYNTETLQPNQFVIPVGGYHTAGFKQRIKQYGEVVLQLTSIEAKYDIVKQTDTYKINATYYLTYTVITPGTTGDTVELPQFIASPYLSYEVVTLGITKAAK